MGPSPCYSKSEVVYMHTKFKTVTPRVFFGAKIPKILFLVFLITMVTIFWIFLGPCFKLGQTYHAKF